MNNIEKLKVVKENLDTMKKSIDNMDNLSIEELKSYMSVVLQQKTKLYPELTSLINKSLDHVNKVLNEPESKIN